MKCLSAKLAVFISAALLFSCNATPEIVVTVSSDTVTESAPSEVIETDVQSTDCAEADTVSSADSIEVCEDTPAAAPSDAIESVVLLESESSDEGKAATESVLEAETQALSADGTFAKAESAVTPESAQGSFENYLGHVYTGGKYSKKYHYEPNCAGKNSHEITWDEVERRGLDPCGKCVLK